MTAEVTILNKKAVAMAADSAATSDKKIFNTHNKLFALSKHHPVGIMIYQNSEFMGYPWETIIKCFREYIGDTYCTNLERYLGKFLVFLERKKIYLQPKTDRSVWQREYTTAVLSKVMNDINSFLENQLSWISDGAVFQQKLDESLTNLEANLSNLALAERHTEENEEAIINEYRDELHNLFQVCFPKIDFTEQQKGTLASIAAKSLVRKGGHNFFTGVVVAGFGQHEQFPSVHCVHINQMLNDRLVYFKDIKVEISMQYNAEIVPFAHSNVVMNMLKGVDPIIENAWFQQVDAVVNSIDEFCRANREKSESARLELIDEVSALYKDQISKLKGHLDKVKFEMISRPVIQGLASCNISEMALMAETLINITNFRQKFSYNEQETVGGPIDVAVISKGDGFIWVKRKHYFERELNNHFFNNYFDNYTTKKNSKSGN